MRRSFAIGLSVAALWVLAHRDLLGGAGEARFPSWDVTRVFWADLAFARRAIAAGELPFWNPWDRAGYSFVAEPQSGFFDPVSWLLVALAVLIGSAPAWLITLKSLIYYGIAGSGLEAYLRERRLPPWTIGFAVVAFVLCPRLDKLKDQSALWPTAWVGWILLAAHRCLRRPDARRGVWLGLAVSAAVLAGYPPGVFRLAFLCVPMGALVAVASWRAAPDRRAYLRELVRALAVSVLVITGLCAAQLWATLGVLPLTERAAISTAEILATRVEAGHWRGFFGVFSETSPLMLYAGLASVIGGALALWLRRSLEVFVLAGIVIMGFALAAGGNLPVLPALAELPGFRSFRIPAHYLIPGSAAAAVLAAIGLGSLTELAPKRTPVVVGVCVAAVLVALWISPEPGAMQVLSWVLSAAAVVAVGLVPARWRSATGWSLVGLLTLDLFAAARPVAGLLRPYPSPERATILTRAMTEPDVYRVADFEWAGNRIGPREGLRDLAGHRPALTDRRYRMIYERASQSAELLRAMNVELAAFPHRVRATRSRRLDTLPEQRNVYRVRDPWPLAFFVTRGTLLDGPEQVLEKLEDGGPPAAWLERDDVPEALRGGLEAGPDDEPSAPVLSSKRANRIAFEIEAPADGLLVVAESWDPGWRAWVDGEPAPVLRANLIQRAVPVPAGDHQVTLAYAPRGLRALCWLFLITLVGSLGWLLARRRDPSLRAACPTSTVSR